MKFKVLLNNLDGTYTYTIESHNILVLNKGTKEIGVNYTDKVLTLLASDVDNDATVIYEGKLDNKLAETLIRDYLK